MDDFEQVSTISIEFHERDGSVVVGVDCQERFAVAICDQSEMRLELHVPSRRITVGVYCGKRAEKTKNLRLVL